MIDFEKELNSEQLEVVKNGDGACLVLAGAGSGKTRTITYRVAYLLEHGIDPKEILLVTFTNKASHEMMQRVSNLTGGKTRLPWAGTFHHVCYRILRQYAPLLGYKSQFSVLDSEDSRDLIKLCVKEESADKGKRRFPSPAVLGSIISFARNAQFSIERVLEEQHPKYLDFLAEIERIAQEYQKRKRAANVMDFDDLLVLSHELFTAQPRVRERFSQQFRYVLVDEYQDTNSIQAAFIHDVSGTHKNVLVVGDDAQSIYSFRAANIENILSFESTYPGARIFKLETNYRSTPQVLGLANDVISRNVHQYEKHLKSHKQDGPLPELHPFADPQEEAEFIAQTILELRSDGVPLSEIAVFFRAAFHSQALEMELTSRDIPYEYRGGVRFFERAHIKDVLAFLRIYSNLSDAIAWSRVLNLQTGIGPATAQGIIAAVQGNGTVDFSALALNLPVRAKIGWNDFLQVWNAMQKTNGTPSQLVDAVMESKYADYLESEFPDYRERLMDIEQLGIFAGRTDDLSQFLGEASMQESFAAVSGRGEELHDEKGVVLSTIHQAKGLEWKAVFVMHLAAGSFPSEMAMRERRGVEEERRLLYVAITRAQEYLYLSYPLLGRVSSMLQGPSMFLEEMDRNLLDEHGISGGETTFFDPSDPGDGITYEAEEDEWKKKKTSFLRDVEDL